MGHPQIIPSPLKIFPLSALVGGRNGRISRENEAALNVQSVLLYDNVIGTRYLSQLLY